MDFGGAGVGGVAEAEVGPLIVGRDVAAAAHHVFALADAVGGEVDGCADGIARASSLPTRLNSTQWWWSGFTFFSSTGGPSMGLITTSIFPLLKRSPKAAPRPEVSAARPEPFTGGHVLEFAVAQVAEQQRALSERGAPVVLIHLRDTRGR